MSGRVAGAAAVALLTVLVGCTGASGDPSGTVPPEPPPITESTVESAPETTAAPTTTVPVESGAPTVPPEAQQQTPDGAAAFVQHWFDTLTYSWEVMQSGPVRELGECLTCIAFADTIDSVASRGNHLEGAELTIDSLAPSQGDADSNSVVALFSGTEQREVAPDGQTVAVIDPGAQDLQFLFDLDWSSGTWTISSVRIIE